MNAATAYKQLDPATKFRNFRGYVGDMRDPVKLNQIANAQDVQGKHPIKEMGKELWKLTVMIAKFLRAIYRAIKRAVISMIGMMTGIDLGQLQQPQQPQQQEQQKEQNESASDKEQSKEDGSKEDGAPIAEAANDAQFDLEKRLDNLTEKATNSFVDALDRHIESPEFAQMVVDLQNGTKSPQEVMDALANSSLETLRQNHDNLKTVLESELDETLKSDIPETALRRAAIQEIISGLPTIEPTYSTVSNPQILEKVNHVLRERSVGVQAFVAAKATLAGMTEAQHQGEFNLEQNDRPVEIPEFLKKPKFPTVQDDTSANMQEFEVAKKYDDEDGRSRPKG